MSSLKASAKNPRPAGALTRALCALGFSVAVSMLTSQAHAACQYTVSGQWSTGFTGTVKITNEGATAVNGWTVNWQYSGDNRISGSYDVALTGTNPYTAKNAGWNGNIPAGGSVTFGFQGSKGSAAAEVPVLTGDLCGNTATSSSRSSSSSSAPSSSAPSSSAPSSSAPSSKSSSSSSSSVVAVAWDLDTNASYLNFVTTKNTDNVEVHNFTSISGYINSANVATLVVDLNTVNTGVALRDQRMRDLLFETATYPSATITVNVPSAVVAGLAVGQSTQTDITAGLDLHGVNGTITTKVSIQKLSSSRILVQTLAPVLVKAGDYSLTDGVEALRAVVGIASISVAVPVDFALVFDAR